MGSIEERLAKELELKINQVNNVIEMLDEGNTVPFIARYRKMFQDLLMSKENLQKKYQKSLKKLKH